MLTNLSAHIVVMFPSHILKQGKWLYGNRWNLYESKSNAVKNTCLKIAHVKIDDQKKKMRNWNIRFFASLVSHEIFYKVFSSAEVHLNAMVAP